MADTVTAREIEWDTVAIALFRQLEIHHGLWQVGARLRFAATNAGASKEETYPSGLVGIQNVMLSPADDADMPLVFDAAKLNPAAKRRSAPTPASFAKRGVKV